MVCMSMEAYSNGTMGIVSVSGNNVTVSLPREWSADGLQRLEKSTNLVDWSTLARQYNGMDWHGTAPLAAQVTTAGALHNITDATPTEQTFYRLIETEAPEYSPAERVSAFLKRATFGPKKSEIDTFLERFGSPDADDWEGPFLAWIDAQINIAPFLHRAWFRSRSDPNYVDQSSLSEAGRNHYGEVGHDSELGHQLICYRGTEAYRPDSSCPFPGHGGPDGKHSKDAQQKRPELTPSQQENDLKYNANLTKHIVWYQGALFAPDTLRQRMAWALSQHFVVGEEGSNLNSLTERWTSYYDIFVRHAFGNFRDILSEVTWHPHMGYYLSHLNNKKARPARGIFPDENYAREVMQLFTIGLWQLQPDGQILTDAEGNAIPTYDNDHITEFARIFTGFIKATDRSNIEINRGNWIDPMRIRLAQHDFGTKLLLDGSLHGPFPTTEAGAAADIEGFLDHLFAHPNVPPFLARFLIQRFTVSNPSPSYIEAVATAFATGLYKGQGSGRRGDLAATLKAVLLHPEAQTASLAFDPAHGKLREPLIRLLHVARAFHLHSDQTYGIIPLQNLDTLLSQGPYQSPSVFNFYRPDYQPNGSLAEKGLQAPEFQIHNDVTALHLPNAIHNLAYNGLRGGTRNASITPRGFAQGALDLAEASAHADEVSNLIEFLDLILCAGRLTDENRAILTAELSSFPGDSVTAKTARVQRAISLFALLPEFNTLY